MIIPPDAALWAAIVDRVQRFTQVTRVALQGRGDCPACVAHARMLALYVAHCELGRSQHQVAEISGRRQQDVAYACLVIEERREDPALNAAIDAMAQDLFRRFPTPIAAANDNQAAA